MFHECNNTLFPVHVFWLILSIKVPKLEIRLGFVDSMNMPDSVNMLTRFREYTSWMLFTQGYKLPKRFVLCRGYPRRVLYLEDSRFLYNPYDNYTSVQRFIFYLIFPWHEKERTNKTFNYYLNSMKFFQSTFPTDTHNDVSHFTKT